MLKKYKKYAIILIAAALIVLPAAGCGTAKNSSQKKQAAQHLLTVWSDHMDVLENMFASELWALYYVDAYLESGDWNDLAKARTACTAAARYLTELSMTEDDLTEEEYLILSKAGIDTSYQTVEFSSVPSFVEEAHNVIRNHLLEGLEYDIYYENSTDILKDQTLTERDSISVMSQYVCIETNYLLLTLGDDTVSKPYWSSMKENYPVLSSEQMEWCEIETELEAAADTCLDKYEAIVLQQSELVSKAEAALYQMTQIIENDSPDTLLSSAHAMSNVPDLLPCPTWYNPHTSGYLSVIIDEDGSVAYPESGDELGDARYGVYIQAENVSEEDIAAYMETAKNYALEVWKSEDSGSWYIHMPDYNVKIDCENDTATILFIGEDVTFAPVWYIWR